MSAVLSPNISSNLDEPCPLRQEVTEGRAVRAPEVSLASPQHPLRHFEQECARYEPDGSYGQAIAETGDHPAPAGEHRLQPLPRHRLRARGMAKEALLVHAGHGGEVRVGSARAEAGDADARIGIGNHQRQHFRQCRFRLRSDGDCRRIGVVKRPKGTQVDDRRDREIPRFVRASGDVKKYPQSARTPLESVERKLIIVE